MKINNKRKRKRRKEEIRMRVAVKVMNQWMKLIMNIRRKVRERQTNKIIYFSPKEINFISMLLMIMAGGMDKR